MARIKNMGTATMRFGEGIILTGSAGDTSDTLIVSGTSIFKDDMQLDVNKRMYFDGSSVANGPFIYGNTTALFIDGDDRVTLSMDKDFRILDEDGNAIIHVTDKDATDNSVYKEFDDVNIFFSGSVGSMGGSTFGAAAFGGDLVVSGNMRVADAVVFSKSGSQDFSIDADNELFVSAGGGVLSYKIKTDGNVEFVNAVTSSHFKVEGTGGQFVAFNEDTVKLKHVNWYSSNDRQYGQGQLWYQQWFGAIEPSDSGAQGGRRIGFFFHEPNKGASDADGGTGAHPTNTHMFLDLGGMTLQTGSLDITAGTLSVTGSDGNSGAASFEDYIMAELSIPGLDIQNDTNAYTFNCPYDMVFEQMDIYMDTANSTNDLDVDMINVDDSSNVIFDINNIQNSGNTVTSDTSPTNATVSRGDRIRFRIANVSGSPQGCRANVRFRRRI